MGGRGARLQAPRAPRRHACAPDRSPPRPPRCPGLIKGHSAAELRSPADLPPISQRSPSRPPELSSSSDGLDAEVQPDEGEGQALQVLHEVVDEGIGATGCGMRPHACLTRAVRTRARVRAKVREGSGESESESEGGVGRAAGGGCLDEVVDPTPTPTPTPNQGVNGARLDEVR